MGQNWISFGLPPMEMLLRPCSLNLHSSAPPTDAAADTSFAYNYHHFFLPPPPAPAADLKLEDLLGPPDALTVDAQDSSSVSTVLAPDSSSPSAAGAAVVPPAAGALAPAPVTGGHRTSVYRGVTRHRWTGRYEAHLWDNTCRREGQKRKGRQVYLGGYDKEERAARAYDLAALKYWGPSATTNFPVSSYSRDIEEMKCMSKQEFIASIRRKSSGFSRGASIYRGVTRHHQHGRWQARIGRVAGNKDLYLGTFATEEEAAEAYDVAAIKFRGVNAVTNFELSRYNVEAIASTDLPIGGGSSAKRIKNSMQSTQLDKHPLDRLNNAPHLNSVPQLLHDLMQLHCPSASSFCSLVDKAAVVAPGECSQSMCLFTGKDAHKGQFDEPQQVGSSVLQL